MKKIYILIIGLISLLNYSCYKDKSNESELSNPSLEFNGYEKNYKVFTHRDTLKINPVVTNEDLYDYYWTVYTTNFTNGTGIVIKPDTLALTKNLNYEVLLNPGEYYLIFNARNKKTGVVNMNTSNLSVSTLNMNGWYILKDNGTTTDFDYIYEGARIDNWIAYYNGGKSMPGKAIRAVYASGFKMTPASKDLFGALAVVSDQDAAIFRIDNGKQVFGFDNMFFTNPGVKKPQMIIQNTGDNFLYLINDDKIYMMSRGTLFANPPVNNYKFSSVSAVGAMTMTFDKTSKSIVFIDGAQIRTVPTNAPELKNMNADLIWAAGYGGLRGRGLLLFRKDDGAGMLVKVLITYGPMQGSNDPKDAFISDKTTDIKTLSKTHGLMTADVIGGNYDSDYIYYAKDNKIYLTDLATNPENLQVTLPEGETVTAIQHIKYPAPFAGTVTTVDYLSIASYSKGKYKIWLHKISSTGTIQALSKPNFEGNGRVSNVIYVEQGKGSKVF